MLSTSCPPPLPADKVLPSVLQKAEVSLLSQTECKKSYGPVSPRMLCAGVSSGERDACRVSSHLMESTKITCRLHLNLQSWAWSIKTLVNHLHSLCLRAIQGVHCPVRHQEGVAGSWLASSAGGRAVADQTCLGSTPGSTSSPPGSTAISADIISYSSTASKCLNILSLAPHNKRSIGYSVQCIFFPWELSAFHW